MYLHRLGGNKYVVGPADCHHSHCNHNLLRNLYEIDLRFTRFTKQNAVTIVAVTVCWSYGLCLDFYTYRLVCVMKLLPGSAITANICAQNYDRRRCCIARSAHWPFVLRIGTQGATSRDTCLCIIFSDFGAECNHLFPDGVLYIIGTILTCEAYESEVEIKHCSAGVPRHRLGGLPQGGAGAHPMPVLVRPIRKPRSWNLRALTQSDS